MEIRIRTADPALGLLCAYFEQRSLVQLDSLSWSNRDTTLRTTIATCKSHRIISVLSKERREMLTADRNGHLKCVVEIDVRFFRAVG